MIEVKGHNISFLEHMVHHENLKNILEYGILSHNKAHKQGLIAKDISMMEVQERRTKKIITVNTKNIGSVHDFVPFYFNAKNPMLYVRRSIQDELVIILIHPDILKTSITDKKFAVYSDGNAGSGKTKFYSGVAEMDKLDLDLIFGGSWNSNDESIKTENKRKRCAEVLVCPSVPVADICRIICNNDNMINYVQKELKKAKASTDHIKVIKSAAYFF